VDSQSLKHSVALENEVVNYGWHMDPEEEEPELEEPDAGASAVDWRGLCQAHVEHERNWRFGRARLMTFMKLYSHSRLVVNTVPCSWSTLILQTLFESGVTYLSLALPNLQFRSCSTCA
jgi:hypothetical protein